MSELFKKIGPAAAVSLVAITTVLHADGGNNSAKMKDFDRRLSALEESRASGTNPSARPVVTGVDIALSGEFLWLKPFEDDLVYATDMHGVVPIVDGNTNGSVKNWKSKFGPAFRIGLTYNMPHDGWDLDLKWLRFNSRHADNDDDRDDCCEQTPGVFQPEFFPKDERVEPDSGENAPYNTIVSPRKWKLRLNEFTLQLGREFFVSKWMTVRPHVGVKGALVHQSMNVDYSGGTFGTGFTDHVRNKNNWWGVGLEGGLNTLWGLGCGVSIYGRADLALLWGKFKVKNSHIQDFAGVRTPISIMKNNFKIIRPVSEIALGLRYDTTFSDDAWALGVWAGWEHHYYWSQNKVIKFVGPVNNILDQWDGDLSLAGLDVGLSVNF